MCETSADGPEELSKFPDETKIDTEIAVSRNFMIPHRQPIRPLSKRPNRKSPTMSTKTTRSKRKPMTHCSATPTPVLRYLRDIRPFRTAAESGR